MKKAGILFCILLAVLAFRTDTEKLPKELRKSFVLIPPGNVKLDKDSVVIDHPYYLSACEISNKQYREFLNAVKSGYREDILKDVQIDSTRWRDKHFYCEPFVKYYHTHPAYDDYPVVNISHQGAVLYCRWLTEKWRKITGNAQLTFRLPTRAEWVRAANDDRQHATYAWEGTSLQNKEGKYRCNFLGFGSENIHFDPATGTYQLKKGVLYNYPKGENDNTSFITTPVQSYWPSAYGLYNMNGNVAEMVVEDSIAVGGGWHSTGYDVRNLSVIPFNGPEPDVGFRPLLVWQ